MIIVLIPIHNRIDFTRSCLTSLKSQKFKDFQTIIVDDGSTDESSEMLRNEFPEVKVINGDGNWWRTKSINVGIRDSIKQNPEYYLLLNNDLVVNDNYIFELEKLGTEFPNSIQGSLGIDIDNHDYIFPGRRFNKYSGISKVVENDWEGTMINILPGRGLLIPTEILRKISFDDRLFPQNSADYDFTSRAFKMVYNLRVNKNAEVYYHVDETGTKLFFGNLNLTNFIKYFLDIRSTCNAKIITRFLLRHVIFPFSFFAIAANLSRCALGYIRRYIVKLIAP